MSKNLLKASALAAIMVTGVVLPHRSQGQVREKSAPPPAPATALEMRARPLIDEPARWPEAARMLIDAAQLRGADDPRAVDDLILAAAAYRWAGKRTVARTTYVNAAERALTLGDVLRSAQMFLCAAVIAHEQKDDAGALELKGRAERLAQSPLLTDAQRSVIRAQFFEVRQYTRP